MTGPGPAPGIKFIYVPAVDLSAIRRFYGTLLGLAEIYYSASEGHLASDCAGLQVSFFHDSAAELAGLCDTIPYEVLSRISPRAERRYVDQSSG